MSLVGKLVFSAFASVNAFGLWKLFQFVYRQLTSPIRHLRGPKGTSWIHGSMLDIYKADATLYEEWVTQYGNTMNCKGFFNINRVFTTDIRAINHVLTHTSDYHKPPDVRYTLSQILGKGVLIVEGAQHRQQRRIMNPAFGPAQIRALTDIFLEKSIRLCDVLSSEIAKNPAGTTTGARIDIIPWLSRMTLDAIGLAGFNYNFDALNANEKPNELNEAFNTVNEVMQKLTTLSILQAWFPLFRILPSDRARTTKVATRTMNRIGRELLSDAKAVARESATEKGEIEKNNLHGRDLLSLLVKANMATDIPESQRLSDEDVLAQVPTFLVAGHETTSTATTWALFALTNATEIQTKLREELLSVDTETPSMDELMALPYLDAVVRETLRVHPPVPNGGRVAMKDDVIPVEKPYTDKHGVVHDSIRISKGDPIVIPILAINRSRELWGPDAHEFKPERWQNIPDAVSQIPGVWGHLLSFLGGPRACIGYRFSIVEMKALLFALIRAFEFELAVPVSEIAQKAEVVQRPVLRSDPESKIQLPLFIKPYKRN
ncbi:cytochrome P450 [Boletus reticuloceps]|uniref:Cytochrome P450 n=1 Tax=Boletus reticuloceps TaxID=495285 RepID=A0A8I2YND4_9AGAM|nr:cytochrome P450 [Boletus reticuloceps]